MKLEYLVSRPAGGNTNVTAIGGVKEIVRNQQRHKGPAWRIRRRGSEWGIWRTSFEATLDRYVDLINAGDVGDVFAFDSKDWPYTTTTRLLDATPPLIQTQGNSKIDAIYTFIARGYKFRSGGICNKRYIDGTTDWTQHSPWGGPDPGSNAFDIFQATMDQMYQTAYDLVAEAKAGRLDIGRVIIGQKQWTPTDGWHSYGGNFHYHIHVEGRPTRTGYPGGRC